MFILIVLLAIMGLIGVDLFVPSLPNIALVFHETPNYTQLLSSLFLAGFALSQLFYGPLSDRFGRKPLLIIGSIIFIIGSLICLTAPTFALLCIGRAIQGIGVGAGLSLARVVIRDSYHGTVLAVKSSQIGMFVSLTPAIAPFVGGILQQNFGFRASFAFLLLYGLIVITLLCTIFKETIKQKNANLTVKSTITNYIDLLKNVMFMRYVIIAGLAFSSIIVYVNTLPFILQNQLHLSATDIGKIILFAALGVSSGSFISSKYVKKFSPQKLVHLGLLFYLSGGLLFTLSAYFFGTHLFILIPILFLITIACGFIFPNALAICFAQVSTNIGIAGAIYGSMQIFIAMLTNFLLNIITHQNQSLLGLFYIAFGLIGLVLFYYRQPKPVYYVAKA